MNLKIKTSESSKKNSLKIAFLLCFLISVQFVFAQNQTTVSYTHLTLPTTPYV